MYNKEVKMRQNALVAFCIDRRAEIMFKNMKKFLSCALAACSIVACAGTLTACETNKPEVEMKIEFNGETYTLEYQMNRKVTPNTVKHFLWLVDGGYYNNTIIHDYDAGALKMYGGLYDYVEKSEGDYYTLDKSYKAFCEKYASSFPASVFTDKGTTPTYTLYGEFSENNFVVKNGALKEGLGSLAMYYHEKETEERVYVKRVDGEGYSARAYEYNSATSMFYISLSTSQKTQKNYCVFATLTEDGLEEFEELKQAIADYIESECDSDADKFVTEKEFYIDQEDDFVGNKDQQATFEVPNEPIIIKSVKVTKY